MQEAEPVSNKILALLNTVFNTELSYFLIIGFDRLKRF